MEIVLFTQRVDVITSRNERRDSADQRISELICTCGFLPMPIPNKPAMLREIVRKVNPAGIVLVGGNSLVKYGGDAQERDNTDKTLIKLSIEQDIPIFGFCRGMQSILDYFGNELVPVGTHVAVRHTISGAEDTVEVNSYHKEASIELKNNELIALMRSKDGVIEKVKHKSKPIVGVMWHPEREHPFAAMDILNIRTLFGGRQG